METLFDGATVRLLVSETSAHVQHVSDSGLMCSREDLQHIRFLMQRQVSGSITLSNGATFELLFGHHFMEWRLDGQCIAHIVPAVREGTSMNDLTGLYSAMTEATADLPEPSAVRPTYGYFLRLASGSEALGRNVEVLNIALQSLGRLGREDFATFRHSLSRGTDDLFLGDLHLQVHEETVTLSPDNRPRVLKPGHHQMFHFEDPLQLSLHQAVTLINAAEFLLEFEDVEETLN